MSALTYQRENLYIRQNGQCILVNCEHRPVSFSLHWHQYAELLYVQAGQLQISVGGATHILKKNSIIFISPCELHSIIGIDHPQAILIQCDIMFLNRFPSVAAHLQNNRLFVYITSEEEDPVFFRHLLEYIQKIVQLIPDNSSEVTDPFADVKQYMLFCQMYMLWLKQKKKNTVKAAPRLSANGRKALQAIQDACAYINQNYTDDITLTLLAQNANMSVSYFSRIFEQYAACSFHTYLSKCRLAHAKNLLANKNSKITDIAFQVGFGSLATFNRVFAKYEGISPKEFRALYNNS